MKKKGEQKGVFDKETGIQKEGVGLFTTRSVLSQKIRSLGILGGGGRPDRKSKEKVCGSSAA